MKKTTEVTDALIVTTVANKNIKSMELYYVDIYTDLDETLTVTVYASSFEEAEAIAITMVESGEAECVGQIVVSCQAYQ